MNIDLRRVAVTVAFLAVGCSGVSGSCRSGLDSPKTDFAESVDDTLGFREFDWHIPAGTWEVVMKHTSDWADSYWWKNVMGARHSNEFFLETGPAYEALNALPKRYVPALIAEIKKMRDPRLDPILGRITGIDVRASSPGYQAETGSKQIVDLWVNWWLQHKDDPEWRDLQ